MVVDCQESFALIKYIWPLTKWANYVQRHFDTKLTFEDAYDKSVK